MRLVISMFALLAFVGCGTPPSEVQNTPRTGEYTCRRLPSEMVYQCLSSIRGRYVDEHASAACDRYASNQLTLECMYEIVDHKFQENAVDVCDSYNNPRQTTLCLRAISNCTYTDAAIKECDAVRDAAGTTACLNYYCNQ